MPTIQGRAVDGVTSWHECTDQAGRAILYTVSSEIWSGPLLVSVEDRGGQIPARRMVGPDWTTVELLDGEAAGLVVFGRFKGDRPGLAAALNIDPRAARAIAADCAVKGLAYEHPAVFSEVRRRLGLSASGLGIALGLAADNQDPQKRRLNAGRSVRRYEADGASPTIALALRWIALQHGVISLDQGQAQGQHQPSASDGA